LAIDEKRRAAILVGAGKARRQLRIEGNRRRQEGEGRRRRRSIIDELPIENDDCRSSNAAAKAADEEDCREHGRGYRICRWMKCPMASDANGKVVASYSSVAELCVHAETAMKISAARSD